MRNIFILLVIASVSAAPASFAAGADKYIIKVPGDCTTIKEACERSLPGDTILLGEGEFTAENGIVFKGNTKLAGQGADKTVLKLGPTGLGIISINGNINNFALKDITVEVNGYPFMVNGLDGLLIKNCVFRGKNLSTCLEISSVRNAQILNCNVVNGGYGLQLWGGPIELTVRNCIFYNNRVGIDVPRPPIMANTRDWPKEEVEKYWQRPREDVRLELEYNVFWNIKDFIDCKKGAKDIMSDPRFANPSKDDYHIKDNSPCIDAGDPDKKYDDPDGSRNDIGAFPSGGKKRK
ncbi:MAG: right-handed parallel beta-helix repeat-containing protein [Candidatus Omnitrophota bacterium]